MEGGEGAAVGAAEGGAQRRGDEWSAVKLSLLGIKELKKIAAEMRPPVDLSGCLEKTEMVCVCVCVCVCMGINMKTCTHTHTYACAHR